MSGAVGRARRLLCCFGRVGIALDRLEPFDQAAHARRAVVVGGLGFEGVGHDGAYRRRLDVEGSFAEHEQLIAGRGALNAR